MRSDIAVVGGGFMGLVVARELQRRGARVELFEESGELGGLAASMDYGSFVWDRFYHCIVPTDGRLLSLLSELGLDDAVRWSRTSSGFYHAGDVYPLKTAGDLLRFRPLPLRDRIRLGLVGLLCRYYYRGDDLEQETAASFLRRCAGDRAWEIVWQPLLKAKLGSAAESISARFIWDSINRLQKARRGVRSVELMGYVSGGYARVLERFGERLRESKVTLRCRTAVRSLEVRNDRVDLVSDDGRRSYEQAVVTTANPIAARFLPAEFAERLNRTSYLGVVVGAVVTRRALTEHYILNISDADIGITGLIGTSNLVQDGSLNGYHLYFAPRYLTQDDPAWGRGTAEWQAYFREELGKLLADLSDDDVVGLHVSRARYVQPLLDCNYRHAVSPTELVPGRLHLVNSSQCYEGPINLELIVSHAERSAARIALEPS